MIAALMTMTAVPVGWAGPVCTDQQVTDAIRVANEAASWAALHRHYAKYRHCDDGAIAEGFSATVARLLSQHWEQARDLHKEAKGEPDFLRFVLKHVDATASEAELRDIVVNSGTRCPAAMRSACGQINTAAGAALKELADLERSQ